MMCRPPDFSSIVWPAFKGTRPAARIRMMSLSIVISCTSTMPATGERAPVSTTSFWAVSRMKAPVAAWFGTVARPRPLRSSPGHGRSTQGQRTAAQRSNTKSDDSELGSSLFAFSFRDSCVTLPIHVASPRSALQLGRSGPNEASISKRCAADDEDVRQVERRPVQVAPMQVEVVDHGADAQPVGDVAERTADQADVGGRLQAAANAAPQHHGERDTDGDADRGERWRCQPPASARNENEAPGLSTWTRLNQAVTVMPVAQRQIRGDHPLDTLVQRSSQAATPMSDRQRPLESIAAGLVPQVRRVRSVIGRGPRSAVRVRAGWPSA